MQYNYFIAFDYLNRNKDQKLTFFYISNMEFVELQPYSHIISVSQ